MKLPHARGYGLLGFFVPVHPEGRVLFGEASDALGEVVNISLLDWLDRHGDDWLCHKHGLLMVGKDVNV